MTDRQYAFKADTNEQPAMLLDLTAKIVTAYLGANHVDARALPDLVQQVHASLTHLGVHRRTLASPIPAVPIAQSVRADYLICLENGRRLKSLKRHLRTSFGLTPDQYREKWGLPASYPMVAPGYSEVRSNLAKANGLGTIGTPLRPR